MGRIPVLLVHLKEEEIWIQTSAEVRLCEDTDRKWPYSSQGAKIWEETLFNNL